MSAQDRSTASLAAGAEAFGKDAAVPVELGLARLAPVFTMAFAAVYFVGVLTNDGVIRFYANVNEIHFSPQPPDLGPPMFWYGWLIDGLIGGIVASAAASFIPRVWFNRFWSLWAWMAVAVPVGLILWLFYLLRGYFTH